MGVLDLLFPRKCLECATNGKYLCESCVSKSEKGNSFAWHISLFKYKGVIRKAILSLKYKFAVNVAEELAMAAVSELKSRNLNFSNLILVPMPMHYRRQNWRGFNQSEELGKLIACKLSWKFEPKMLAKTHKTNPQARLAKSDRAENIKGVFLVNKKISGGNYIIFDDVWTTGSTMKEARKVLIKAGAKQVYGLTVAG